MNQPPGYPPGGPPYPGAPGQPGAFPQQGQAPQGQQPPQGNFGGTMLMPSSPQAQQAQAQAMAAAQQQGAYGQPPPGAPPAFGAPPGAPYGAPPGAPGGPPGAYGAPPPGAYGAPPGMPGAPPGAYGAPPPGVPYGAPPGAPGYGGAPGYPGGPAPGQAPPPQQGGGMSFGLGGVGPGGIPRIKVGVGDYHPNKLLNAVVKGEGYEKPRMFGLVMLGISIAFAVINAVLIFVLHLYYPYLYLISGPLWWGGWFMLIFGQPKAPPDGSKTPMWARIGLGACIAIGLLLGGSMSFLMHWGD
jgi:hypothetical protein